MTVCAVRYKGLPTLGKGSDGTVVCALSTRKQLDANATRALRIQLPRAGGARPGSRSAACGAARRRNRAGTGRAIGVSVVLTVLTAVAAQVGRSGKRLEPGLCQEWGGSPTLRRLRYHGAADAGVVRRLHQRIEAVLGDPMPTTAEEQTDPTSADARYEEATRRLVGLTRDRKQFRLLFAENVNYGMRRNLLGLRWTGIAVAAVTVM